MKFGMCECGKTIYTGDDGIVMSRHWFINDDGEYDWQDEPHRCEFWPPRSGYWYLFEHEECVLCCRSSTIKTRIYNRPKPAAYDERHLCSQHLCGDHYC